MKRYSNPRGTALFVFIAVVLMTFSHLFFYNGLRYLKGVPVSASLPVVDEVAVASSLPQPVPRVNSGRVYDRPLFEEFNAAVQTETETETEIAETPKKKDAPLYSLKNPNPDSPARIAIIIDDMGISRRLSKAVVDYRGAPLTLAFLPYAKNLPALTEPAKKNGHELMIHMPMEAMNSKIDTGPIALKDGMNRAEVDVMLAKAFASFEGYAGLNNHMGSRMTQDSEVMGWVMEALGKRDLFYVDSKTIETSVAADSAREAGLDYAVRDVFLDHEESVEFVRGALEKVEKVALARGHAIAIGHPKGVTLGALKAWIPTLEARGFEIVPVSELLMAPKGKAQDAIEVVHWDKPKAAMEPAFSYSDVLLMAPLTVPASSELYQLPLPQPQ